MEYPHPIDVVYTWVNGSDEELIKKLNFYKANMYLDMFESRDREIKSAACSLDNCAFIGHILATLVTQSPHQSRSIQGYIQQIQTHLSILNNNQTIDCYSLRFIPRYTNSRKEGYLLKCSNKVTNVFNNRIEIQLELDQSTHIRMSPIYIAAGSNKTKGIRMENSVMLVGFAEIRDAVTEKRWISQIEEKINATVSVTKVSPMSFLITSSKIDNSKMTPESICSQYSLTTLQHKGLECKTVLYLPDHLLTTVLHDISGSRYHDNEELKYSLRSLDKYLEEYGQIFIVTNGQIPAWLDLDHPRIKMIFHSDIFPNSSHLPTFNSAAIEANLHNIPGLSQHFIYLNDDVFFGKPIYASDFYNLELGYSVYLGWEVPNCVENCPNSWLGDSFCDQDCNVQECGWDAGDCRNKINLDGTNKGGYELFPPNTNETENWMKQYMGNHNLNNLGNNQNTHENNDMICKSGCNKKWLADRYCDVVCNVLECGYDMGDCGDVEIKQKGRDMNDNSIVLRKIDLEKTKNASYGSPIEIPRDSKLLGIEFYVSKNDAFHIVSIELTDLSEIYVSSYAAKYKLLLALLSRHNRKIKSNDDIPVISCHVKWTSNSEKAEYTNKYTIRISNSLKTKLDSNGMLREVQLTTKSTHLAVHLPEVTYTPPRQLFIEKNQVQSINFNQSVIEKLEWKHPIEMSRYRLLLKDGLLTKSGYFQLVLQLLKSNQSKEPKLKMTRQTAIVNNDKLENLDWGFLPWERLVNIDPYRSSSSPHGLIRQITNKASVKSSSRKLMDLYSESLRFSNRVISQLFHYKQRKVPAHGPHFVSKSILKDAHDKFHDYWQDTSAHRFRNPSDIQFAFTYFHYLMTENRTIDIRETLQVFDTDYSGSLNMNELRSLLVSMNVNETISDEKYSDIVSSMQKNCTSLNTSQPKREIEIKIENLVSNCYNWTEMNGGVDILGKSKPRYPHQIIDDPDLEFIMISTKRERVLHKLDILRKSQKKFFCLNDNLPNAKNSKLESTIRKDVRQFLQYFYPFPSQFEKRSDSSKQQQSKLHHYYTNIIFIFLFVMVLMRLLCHVIHVYHLKLNRRMYLWFSKRTQLCRTQQLDP